MSSCAGRAGGIWPPQAARDPAQAEDVISATEAGSADIGGVMSQDCSLNPDFCTWNKLFMHYWYVVLPADGCCCPAASSSVAPHTQMAYTNDAGASDGASFGGSRIEPIEISTRAGKPAQMWMRGRNNFDAMISYFLTNSTLGMSKATDVILSGGSAGGLAVFYNLDHVATLLPKSTRLVGFPDAGFFLVSPVSQLTPATRLP